MRPHHCTVYPKKYAHGFCFAVLCCDYTLTDFPISIRLTSLALWQSNDCPSASKATLMNMDKYFMWIHYERLHNHNKAKHNIYFLWYTVVPGLNRWKHKIENLNESLTIVKRFISTSIHFLGKWSYLNVFMTDEICFWICRAKILRYWISIVGCYNVSNPSLNQWWNFANWPSTSFSKICMETGNFPLKKMLIKMALQFVTRYRLVRRNAQSINANAIFLCNII